MFEKRTNKRSPIELAASFGIGEDPRPEREAKIHNVSSSGFCLTSDHKMRIGDEIELVIDLDTSNDVMIFVKVVWVKKIENSKQYTVGVQILEKEGPDYDQFIEYYNKQL
jgi:Tfp pilus assembly protein PilZ